MPKILQGQSKYNQVPIAKRFYGYTIFQFYVQSWMKEKQFTCLLHIHDTHPAWAGSLGQQNQGLRSALSN